MLEAYCWLVREYREGDEVYLVGFSRGAYTVRSLAGLIRNVGILRAHHAGRVDEAYEHYRDRSQRWAPTSARSALFRDRFSWPMPRLAFLGVWDTVGSLGVPIGGPLGWLSRRRYGFHDVELSGIVRTAYHALAIDERRRPFEPTLWEVDRAHAGSQEVRQAWFAGSHGNIGGGSADTGLSDIALQWIASGAQSRGLCLDPSKLPADDYRYRAPLEDSARQPFWSLLRVSRPMGRPPLDRDDRTLLTYEELHPAARDRHTKCLEPPYAPRNLLAYLAEDPELVRS